MSQGQAASPPQWEVIGHEFLKFYYPCFDGDRSKLISLFVSTTQRSSHALQQPPHVSSLCSFLTASLLPCVLCGQRDSSLLTSERKMVQGPQLILEMLQALPKMAHKVTSVQYQPTPTGQILIVVSGELVLEGQTNELKFSEVFQLASDQPGAFFIQNNIFSLNYG